jgi:predicted ATPase
VPRVLEHADALLALAREHDLSFFRGEGSWLREWALVHQGDVEGGLTRFRQVVTTRLATHGVLVQPYALACLAEAHGHAGQPDAGLRVVAEALALADTHGVHWYDAELYRLQGELVLQQAADDEVAERHFQQARALARQQGARFWELRAVVSLNRLWHRQGKTTKARALLEAACQTFTEGFETPDLCRAWALLDTSHRSGDGGWRARRSSRGSRRS